MNDIRAQFISLRERGFLALFEIIVIDVRTDREDFVICDIDVDDSSFFCQRIAINEKEEKSDKIATTSVDLDLSQSLNWHLEGLLDAINQDIINNSTYFKLPEDE